MKYPFNCNRSSFVGAKFDFTIFDGFQFPISQELSAALLKTRPCTTCQNPAITLDDDILDLDGYNYEYEYTLSCKCHTPIHSSQDLTAQNPKINIVIEQDIPRRSQSPQARTPSISSNDTGDENTDSPNCSDKYSVDLGAQYDDILAFVAQDIQK